MTKREKKIIAEQVLILSNRIYITAIEHGYNMKFWKKKNYVFSPRDIANINTTPEKVLKYTQGRELYLLIAEYLNLIHEVKKLKNHPSKMRTYLMKDLNTGLYKIGRSKNPAARESTLQSEKPTIKMVKVWEEDIEKELHRMYEKERVRGEWFNLSEIQVKFITSKQ